MFFWSQLVGIGYAATHSAAYADDGETATLVALAAALYSLFAVVKTNIVRRQVHRGIIEVFVYSMLMDTFFCPVCQIIEANRRFNRATLLYIHANLSYLFAVYAISSFSSKLSIAAAVNLVILSYFAESTSRFRYGIVSVPTRTAIALTLSMAFYTASTAPVILYYHPYREGLLMSLASICIFFAYVYPVSIFFYRKVEEPLDRWLDNRHMVHPVR